MCGQFARALEFTRFAEVRFAPVFEPGGAVDVADGQAKGLLLASVTKLMNSQSKGSFSLCLRNLHKHLTNIDIVFQNQAVFFSRRNQLLVRFSNGLRRIRSRLSTAPCR